jgi:hypothetical protein
MQFKDFIIIFLTLLLWIQFTLVIILGVKLGWNKFHQPTEIKKDVLTPGMLKGKI